MKFFTPLHPPLLEGDTILKPKKLSHPPLLEGDNNRKGIDYPEIFVKGLCGRKTHNLDTILSVTDTRFLFSDVHCQKTQ
jgi:hypothetical protein